ncbi:hypothetical protein CEP51_004602 [Fusarium floridanum]|uniref:Heterokaryon incompatibility domain-containing protein n=1 Tax=Fusarium floridanum TaxID=1325733 RepID=A0A428S0B3_9HYPO|nr:hypothetical protein CEP51_004602 [Fusarium floridanum]
MSRWHKSSCHSPRVSIEDGLLQCQSCDSSPNIQKLVSEQASLSPPWSVPPDESFGEMNLSWPGSVLYSPQIRDTTRTDAGEAKGAKDLGRQHEPPHIYNRRLENNEFRLIYLPAVDDESRPIHASIEAYQVDDCPEYETVSYCWGGENGDTTLCKPVFLGDYWDILLQTQNCWSMLHYLRPRIGVRVVWVDAICINQTDHQERESQVAIMGSIYQRCLRTVVYLGQDVVARHGNNNSNRAYPARRDLNTESASAVDLHHLLKMRYFQRVWVIQELVLSPMVVIPVNGVELIARRRGTASRDEVAWHESDAPWMRYLCAERSDTSLKGILEETQNSQSTDPRDKVFGLLGVLSGSTGFRPDYLLSERHIYVGTIAYMLLNESHSYLLIEAAGHQASPEVPSWLPDGNLSSLGALFQILSNFRSRLDSGREAVAGVNFWVEMLELNPDWEMLLLAHNGENQDYRHSHDQLVGSINPTTSALTLRLS